MGLTKTLPGVPEELRGTYAGLGHPATITHLKSLGITAIELLPIHAKMSEPFLTHKGLENYWGYNTLGFRTRAQLRHRKQSTSWRASGS